MTKILDSANWLGPVGDTWSAVPIFDFLKIEKTLVGGAWSSTQLLSLTKGGVVERDIESGEGKMPASFEDYQVVKNGDLVLCLFDMDETPRTVGLSPLDGMITGAYRVAEIDESTVDPRFIEYMFLAIDDAKAFKPIYTGLRKTVGREDLLRQRFALPDLETQRRIADYLEKEISEMDALIDEFEGLAKNLSARRARLVNRIVEKHAKTQEESGDPWDRHFFKLLVESHFAGDWGSEIGHDEVDLPCVRVADFNRATSSLAEEIPTIRSYSESTYQKKHLVRDDLLVEKSGGGEKTPVGSVVLYEGDSSALCANFIEVIRLRRGQVPRFWVHMFRANFVAGETFRFVKQTTGIQNLDMQMFLDQKFVVPPSGKQREIADELDHEFERMDALIEESTRLIENLKARKTALITEVVTGRKEV